MTSGAILSARLTWRRAGFAGRRVKVSVGQPRASPEDSDPGHNGFVRRCSRRGGAELSETRQVPSLQ
jgi:hypothetical protein